jgi:hypothetical protein
LMVLAIFLVNRRENSLQAVNCTRVTLRPLMAEPLIATVRK